MVRKTTACSALLASVVSSDDFPDPTSVPFCNRFVTFVAGTENSYCFDLCQALYDQGVTEAKIKKSIQMECGYHHWTVGTDSDGSQYAIPDECFSTLQFSRDTTSEWNALYIVPDTIGPAVCQQECQDYGSDCGGWIISLIERNCFLFDESTIVTRSVPKGTAGAAAEDLCSGDTEHECLQCNGEDCVSIFDPAGHLSGDRYCDFPWDLCSKPVQEPPDSNPFIHICATCGDEIDINEV